MQFESHFIIEGARGVRERRVSFIRERAKWSCGSSFVLLMREYMRQKVSSSPTLHNPYCDYYKYALYWFIACAFVSTRVLHGQLACFRMILWCRRIEFAFCIGSVDFVPPANMNNYPTRGLLQKTQISPSSALLFTLWSSVQTSIIIYAMPHSLEDVNALLNRVKISFRPNVVAGLTEPHSVSTFTS